MEAMKKAFSTVAIAALVALAPALPIQAAGAPAPTPTPIAHTGTPPPTIYHVVTRPLCAELHKHIAPAVGMLLENDRTMKNSPKLFTDYNHDRLLGVDNSVSNGAGMQGGVTMSGESAGSNMNAAQNMTILKMENMVSPIANNIIAMQKILDTPSLLAGTGNPDDDKRLVEIRTKLLKAIADQNATLDIINGFVQTTQMGDLQHSGDEYVQAMNQPDVTGKAAATGVATPNPLMVDPNQAGLPANPYDFNPAAIPGLALGANPVTRLLQAVNWTIDQTRANENDASVAIMGAAQVCGSGPAPAPAPTPAPH
jgi:hypothetical protein